MRINSPNILITGEIDGSLLKDMTAEGFEIDVVPFIQTEIIKTKKIQAQIESILGLNTTVVFTSANGVKAVSQYWQNKKPAWKIYCIGNTTKNLVEKLFGKVSVTATANDAATLAEKIASVKTTHEVYFFCGDKRRDELPGLLKQNGIDVHEIEIYTTTILQHHIEKDYNAVLFFSPSAATGFFENNKLSEKTILFAIGHTTVNEIKKYSNNKIVVSDRPGKIDVLKKAVAYFVNG